MSDLVSPSGLFAPQNWTDMSVHTSLVTYAVLGIPAGLLLGMLLGLVARRDVPGAVGWGAYGSFPRRAARLAHVAAVMLPALAGLYAVLLGDAATVAALWGARVWIVGGVCLPAALVVAAFRPRRSWLVALPATCVVVASLLFAAAFLQGGVR